MLEDERYGYRLGSRTAVASKGQYLNQISLHLSAAMSQNSQR